MEEKRGKPPLAAVTELTNSELGLKRFPGKEAWLGTTPLCLIKVVWPVVMETRVFSSEVKQPYFDFGESVPRVTVLRCVVVGRGFTVENRLFPTPLPPIEFSMRGGVVTTPTGLVCGGWWGLTKKLANSPGLR